MRKNSSTPLRTESHHHGIRFRRTLGLSLATLLVSTGALVCTAQPASALTDYLRPVSVSYTDSRTPTRNHAGQTDFPVGSWQAADGKHTARAYLTFDLSEHRGRQVISAVADTGETAVNDCGKAREIEVWRTDTPASPPTWRKAPAVREKVGEFGADFPACPTVYMGLLVDAALQHALDNGDSQVTFMFRIKDGHEGNPQHGRRLKPLGISVRSNAAPDVPTDLHVLGHTCGGEILVNTTTPTFSAMVTDPDSTGIYSEPATATFAFWPVDQPDERTEATAISRLTPATMSYTVPPGAMIHGRTYAFAVRAADQYAASTWSAECPFTVDTSVPPSPTVESADYPATGQHGGPGIPGQFTFHVNGDTNVVGYWYGLWEATTNYVAAEKLDGSATVSITPTSHGPTELYVYSVNRAGTRSARTIYDFWVLNTAPIVSDENPMAGPGEPRQVTFEARMPGVVEYTYRLNDGETQTVAADSSGNARVTIVLTEFGTNTLWVQSRTTTGLATEVTRYLYLSDRPTVSSVEYPVDGSVGAPAGTPGTFVFRSAGSNIESYRYQFSDGGRGYATADPDGSTTVVFTPATPGVHWLTVTSISADGYWSDEAYVEFIVG